MNGLSIRPLTGRDREPILAIVRDTGMFTEAEVEVARELIDVWLDRPEQKDYLIYTAELDGVPVGYVCFGPTPATEFTFDLYWIAVAPDRQRCGIGQSLLDFAQKECLKRGGRLIVIETSSLPKYEPTRKFYFRNGYLIEATIKDFYARNDDRLIFTRRFPDGMANGRRIGE